MYEKRIMRYARRKILMHAGLSLRKLQHILKNHTADLMHIQTEDDVERIVKVKRTKINIEGPSGSINAALISLLLCSFIPPAS